MRALLLATALALLSLPVYAQQSYTQPGINPVGRGCTTAFFLDPLCKPCGTGMKSSGQYPVWPIPPSTGSTIEFTGNATVVSGNTTVTVNSVSLNTLKVGQVITFGAQGVDVPWNTTMVQQLTGTSGDTCPAVDCNGTTGTYQMSNAAYANATATLNAYTQSIITMGDMPDADPNDPHVCTTPQWESKWGWSTSVTSADNAAMKNYLQNDVGFTNNANIYYVNFNADTSTGLPSGNDSTCASAGAALPNDPSHPCASMAPIMTALKTVATDFSGATVTFSGSSRFVTIACNPTCTGTLSKGSLLTATGLTSAYIIKEIQNTAPNGAAGTAGVYWIASTTSSTPETNETVTGGHQPGGVIVVGPNNGAQWVGCAGATVISGCLNIGSGQDGNPGWEISGSRGGHTLLFMAFPGARIILPNMSGNDTLDLLASSGVYPKQAACCFIMKGFIFWSPVYGIASNSGQVNIEDYSDFTLENDELAGHDKIFGANHDVNFVLKDSVIHDMASHGFYMGSSGCATLPTPGRDTNFALDEWNYVNSNSCGATYNPKTIDDVFYGDSWGDGYGIGGDTIHYNAFIDGGLVSGVVMDYSCNPVGLQTSPYFVNVIGNLFFDNCEEPFLEWTYSPEAAMATMTAGSNQINITSIVYTSNGLAVNDFVADGALGCIPPGDTFSAAPSPGPTGVWTLTTAVSSNAACSYSGEIVAGNTFAGSSTIKGNVFANNVVWVGSPATGNLIQGTTPSNAFRIGDKSGTGSGSGISPIEQTIIENNTVVTTNNTGTTAAIPFYYLANGHPELDTITGNSFWSDGTDNNSVTMRTLNLNTQASGTLPNSATYPFGGGTGCNSASASFLTCFPSNTFLSSAPFPGESNFQNYQQTPGLYSFGKYKLW